MPKETLATDLEVGDRFDISLSSDGQTILLPDSFLELNHSIEELLGPDDLPLQFHHSGSLFSLELSRPLSSELAGVCPLVGISGACAWPFSADSS